MDTTEQNFKQEDPSPEHAADIMKTRPAKRPATRSPDPQSPGSDADSPPPQRRPRKRVRIDPAAERFWTFDMDTKNFQGSDKHGTLVNIPLSWFLKHRKSGSKSSLTEENIAGFIPVRDLDGSIGFIAHDHSRKWLNWDGTLNKKEQPREDRALYGAKELDAFVAARTVMSLSFSPSELPEEHALIERYKKFWNIRDEITAYDITLGDEKKIVTVHSKSRNPDDNKLFLFLAPNLGISQFKSITFYEGEDKQSIVLLRQGKQVPLVVPFTKMTDDVLKIVIEKLQRIFAKDGEGQTIADLQELDQFIDQEKLDVMINEKLSKQELFRPQEAFIASDDDRDNALEKNWRINEHGHFFEGDLLRGSQVNIPIEWLATHVPLFRRETGLTKENVAGFDPAFDPTYGYGFIARDASGKQLNWDGTINTDKASENRAFFPQSELDSVLGERIVTAIIVTPSDILEAHECIERYKREKNISNEIEFYRINLDPAGDLLIPKAKGYKKIQRLQEIEVNDPMFAEIRQPLSSLVDTEVIEMPIKTDLATRIENIITAMGRIRTPSQPQGFTLDRDNYADNLEQIALSPSAQLIYSQRVSMTQKTHPKPIERSELTREPRDTDPQDPETSESADHIKDENNNVLTRVGTIIASDPIFAGLNVSNIRDRKLEAQGLHRAEPSTPSEDDHDHSSERNWTFNEELNVFEGRRVDGSQVDIPMPWLLAAHLPESEGKTDLAQNVRGFIHTKDPVDGFIPCDEFKQLLNENGIIHTKHAFYPSTELDALVKARSITSINVAPSDIPQTHARIENFKAQNDILTEITSYYTIVLDSAGDILIPKDKHNQAIWDLGEFAVDDTIFKGTGDLNINAMIAAKERIREPSPLEASTPDENARGDDLLAPQSQLTSDQLIRRLEILKKIYKSKQPKNPAYVELLQFFSEMTNVSTADEVTQHLHDSQDVAGLDIIDRVKTAADEIFQTTWLEPHAAAPFSEHAGTAERRETSNVLNFDSGTLRADKNGASIHSIMDKLVGGKPIEAYRVNLADELAESTITPMANGASILPENQLPPTFNNTIFNADTEYLNATLLAAASRQRQANFSTSAQADQRPPAPAIPCSYLDVSVQSPQVEGTAVEGTAVEKKPVDSGHFALPTAESGLIHSPKHTDSQTPTGFSAKNDRGTERLEPPATAQPTPSALPSSADVSQSLPLPQALGTPPRRSERLKALAERGAAYLAGTRTREDGTAQQTQNTANKPETTKGAKKGRPSFTRG